jgi:hypothetical protein
VVGVTRNDRQRERDNSRLAAAREDPVGRRQLRTICLPAKYRQLMP